MFQLDACALILLGEEARDLCIPAPDSIRKQFRYFDLQTVNKAVVVVDPVAMEDAKTFSAFIENCTRFARNQDGVLLVYPPDCEQYRNNVAVPRPVHECKGLGESFRIPLNYDIKRAYWVPPSSVPSSAPQERFLLSVRLGRGAVPRRQRSGPDLTVLWR